MGCQEQADPLLIAECTSESSSIREQELDDFYIMQVPCSQEPDQSKSFDHESEELDRMSLADERYVYAAVVPTRNNLPKMPKQ